MIPQVVLRPYQFSFSKNQLLWRFYIADPATAGCVLDFKIICDTLSADPDLRRSYQTQVKPGSDGYVNVYLQDIIDSMIDHAIPVISGDIIQPAANIRLVSMQFRQLTDADPDTAWITTEPDRYVIKGGIELLKHDYNNYFLNYHAANKPFATWQPANSFVNIADEFYTSFLLTNTSIPNWILRVVAEWTDGTNDVIDIDVDDHTKIMYHVKAGAEALGINALAIANEKILWRYSLQVRDDADNTISYTEAFMFYADYRKFYNAKLFSFFNSLGGIDHARILGDQEDDYQRNFAEGETFTGSSTPGDPPLSQYFQVSPTRLNTYKSDAGLRHTSAQMMRLQELLTSALIWEIISSKNRRLWILNKNAALKKKTDKKWAFPIEWRYGFTEQVYTPIEIDLGVGDDGETYPGAACPIPAGITVHDLGGGSVEFNWTNDAAALYYTLEYKLTTDSSWTDYGSHIVGGDLPVTIAVTVGLDYDWRIKCICDDVDYPESAYVYGIFIGI